MIAARLLLPAMITAVKPWTQFNCYEALNVAADADDAAIRAAYHALSRQAHPDQGGSHDAQVRANLAFKILTDPQARIAHDIHWRQTDFPAPPREPAFVDSGAMRRLWNGAKVVASRGIVDTDRSSGLVRRVRERITRDVDRIDSDQIARAAQLWSVCGKQLLRARAESALCLSLSGGLGFISFYYPAGWALTAIGLAATFWRARPLRAAGKTFLPIDPTAGPRLRATTRTEAATTCARDRARLEIHENSLRFLEEMALRPTRITDPEGLVKKRLIALFFLLGATVEGAAPSRRLLILDQEGERIVVRWRHGDGPALALDALERIGKESQSMRASQTYLIYPPGLTPEAAARADELQIRTYDLDGLNRWARALWLSDNAGPSGDILTELAHLHERLLAP